MKIVLAAVNAKYIHSNPAVYSLRAFARSRGFETETAEFTINQRADDILAQLYMRKADVLCFSCYIWNIEYVKEIAEEIKKLSPQTAIWGGGPEVSFETEQFLKDNPAFDGVMQGEGEQIFSELCSYYFRGEPELKEIDGIVWKNPEGNICSNPPAQPMDMDDIPFYYENLGELEHRIVYYESSRGCPFSCSYCLSSIDKKLRFRSLDKVFQELQFFLDHRVPQVKFVDRTFNCRHDHAKAIWKYLMTHDNGVTNFHFEISADLLTEEELQLIAGMRPGLIQLEIGVQSVNPKTLCEIHRKMDLEKLKKNVAKIREGHNVHQHLDLIAGLPFENEDSFRHSFNEVYKMRPQQLQLGFLKVLKGSFMYDHAAEYGVVYAKKPPYEVRRTDWLNYDEVLDLKMVEEMTEIYYNSNQYMLSLKVLEPYFEEPFLLYHQLGVFHRDNGYMNRSFSRMGRCMILREFAASSCPQAEKDLDQALLFDLYIRENMKSRPAWAENIADHRKKQMEYLRRTGRERKYCHMEPFKKSFLEKYGLWTDKAEEISGNREKVWVLFDYEKRDPLTAAAAYTPVLFQNEE